MWFAVVFSLRLVTPLKTCCNALCKKGHRDFLQARELSIDGGDLLRYKLSTHT
jgi:hypothetical protein